MDYIGRVNRNVPINPSRFTQDTFVHSVLGAPSNLFLPAPMSRYVERLRLQQQDLDPTRCVAAPADLLRATEFVLDWWSLPEGWRPLDHATTVAKILAGDTRDKSPGFPWTGSFPSKEAALADSSVTDYLQHYYDALDTPDEKWCYFSLSLKDEILKAKKVQDNSTRLFMVGPLEHYYASVRIFGMFSDYIFAHAMTLPVTAGQSFFYGGWDHMMRRIKSPRYLCSDAHSFDSHVLWQFYSCFYIACQRWFHPSVHGKIFSILMQSLHAALVTSDGYVVMKHAGNPSGQFLTLLLNSFIHCVIIAYSFIRLHPDCNRFDFLARIKANVVGDDGALGVDDPLFTRDFYINCWAECGFIVKECHEFTDIRDVDYCGGTSVEIFNVLVRRPRVDKLLASLHYTKTFDLSQIFARYVSIMIELWPERSAYLRVRGLVTAFRDRYPLVCTVPIPGEGELRYLHAGLQSGFVSMCPIKSSMEHGGTFANIPGLVLSGCAREYAESLTDPCAAPPSCLPKTDAEPSGKYHVYCRGEGATGSNGVGYVAVIPAALITNDYASGGLSAINVTTNSGGNFSGTNLPQLATTGMSNFYTNSPFTTTQFGSGTAQVRYKLVSACIRVKLRQTVMNAGGVAIGLTHPQHMTLAGYSDSNLLSFEQTYKVDLSTQKWVDLIYTGYVTISETQYSTSFASVAGTNTTMCMAIMLKTSTALSIFDFEVYGNFEITGAASGSGGSSPGSAGASPMGKTPSEIDDVGAGLVVNAIQTARLEAGDNHDGTKAFKLKVRANLISLARRSLTFLAPRAAAAVAVASGVGAPYAGAASAAASAGVAGINARLKAKEKKLKAKAKALKAPPPRKQ